MLSLSVSTVIKLSVGTLGWTSGICCSSLSPHLHIKDTVPHNALCHTKDTVPYRALRHTNTYRALSHIKDTVSYRAFCFCNISKTLSAKSSLLCQRHYIQQSPLSHQRHYTLQSSLSHQGHPTLQSSLEHHNGHCFWYCTEQFCALCVSDTVLFLFKQSLFCTILFATGLYCTMLLKKSVKPLLL